MPISLRNRFASWLWGDVRAGTPGPADDYWYRDVPAGSASGMKVDAETAQKISAYYRGVDLLSTALAMLPLKVLRRLPDDGGAEVAKVHPLYDVLHRKPNAWQDSFSWRRTKMRHLINHGNSYDRIIPGRRGFVDQLWPIHPSRVSVTQVESGRLVYSVRDPQSGGARQFTQDEIFHLRGASDDGIVGKGVLAYARDSLGTALATEAYAAKIFSRGTLNGGVIETPGVMDGGAGKRMAESFITAGGNWHLPKVLEQGATWKESQITPEDSQMLASRKFSIDDIARWLGVPPHMIGSLDRSTNNNIEQQGQEFVTYSLGLWLSLWEFAINDQLILVPDVYYAEFERDALVRGDIAARWDAYQKAITTGTFTRNEIRRKENANRLDGLDEPLTPANITGKPAPEPAPKAPPAAPAGPSRGRAIAQSAAARLIRKELASLQKAAVKTATNSDQWAIWVTEFYAKHAAIVADTLQVSQADAEVYCAGQAQQVIDGLAGCNEWESDAYVARVAEWALGEDVA